MCGVPKISAPSLAVREAAKDIVTAANAKTCSEKLIALYSFVHNEIVFGFTPNFDSATPDYTLVMKKGHCNPQGALLASLCNAVGVPARLIFVRLRAGVLTGILDGVLDETGTQVVSHSFIQAEVESGICALDGYVVDEGLWRGATERCRKEGKEEGYGVSVKGTSDWAGRGDCFIQMVDQERQVVAKYGAWDVPDDFLESDMNVQRFG